MCKLLHDPIIWVVAWYVSSSAVYETPAPGEKSGRATNGERGRLNRP